MQSPAFPPNQCLVRCPVLYLASAQPLPLPARSKIPISSLYQLCPLLCTWFNPRPSPLDLVSISLLWVPLFQSSLYFLQEWSDHWRPPSACMMQPKLPWETSRSGLTPHHPCSCFLSSGHTVSFSPWTGLVFTQAAAWTGLFLHPCLRKPYSLLPIGSSSEALPQQNSSLCSLY